MRLAQPFILQQGNDIKYSAKLTKKYSEKNLIKLMDCPMSPDLNPIEHLCDELDRRIPTIKRLKQSFV